MRFHLLFLAPWIVLSVPSKVFLGLGTLLVLLVVGFGLAGMIARMTTMATLASVALLGVLLAGRVGTDLDRLPSQDTAVLLIQFMSIVFFVEAVRAVSSYDSETRMLGGRTDESTQLVRIRLQRWIRGQLTQQARLAVGALGLSLFLLVLGGLTSVSINQVTFSAILVLIIVGVLLFIITQRREPVTRLRY